MVVPTARAAWQSLAFAVTFQIGLCLIVHCAGISIVWCAAAGWMIMSMCGFDKIKRRQQAAARDNHNNNNNDNSTTRGQSPPPPQNSTSSSKNSKGRLWWCAVGVPLFLDGGGILFYAVTAEHITTVAHGCALVLGAALFWFASSRRS